MLNKYYCIKGHKDLTDTNVRFSLNFFITTV